MRFGVWYDFRNPARWRQPYDRLYAEVLEQAAWAETLGYESVWVSEHHVTDEGYLPSTFPMLAALAMRTETVRLGSAIVLAPFQHPLRFAEDAAVVDHLSRGRLELGVAPGYRVEEFAAFDVDRRERGSRTDELVDVARAAWTGRPFSYHGKHWRFEDVIVTPPPFQESGPPVWIGGASIAAARRAGRLGCHFMPDSFAPLTIYEEYRRSLAEHGWDPASFSVSTNRILFAAEDPEVGWDLVKDHYLYVFNRYREWFAAAGDFPEAGELLDDAELLPRDVHVVGTPGQIIAEIERMQSRFSFDRLIFWAKPPGLPIEASNRSLELIARHVIPHFEDGRPFS